MSAHSAILCRSHMQTYAYKHMHQLSVGTAYKRRCITVFSKKNEEIFCMKIELYGRYTIQGDTNTVEMETVSSAYSSYSAMSKREIRTSVSYMIWYSCLSICYRNRCLMHCCCFCFFCESIRSKRTRRAAAHKPKSHLFYARIWLLHILLSFFISCFCSVSFAHFKWLKPTVRCTVGSHWATELLLRLVCLAFYYSLCTITPDDVNIDFENFKTYKGTDIVLPNIDI